jgi:hypothetical protein
MSWGGWTQTGLESACSMGQTRGVSAKYRGLATGLISAWIFYFCRILRCDCGCYCRFSGISKLRKRSTIDTGRHAIAAAPAIAGARGFVVIAVLAASLAGCGSISERTAATAFTSPGKYYMYSCHDVETGITTARSRQQELEQLMARSSQSVGGEFVNTIAYRGEYAQTRGELLELAQAKADKQCASDSKFSSGRAVF